MNSRVESSPRVRRMWFRTAASTSTARLRPGATARVTVGISTPRMSCVPERVASRSRGSTTPPSAISRLTMSRNALRGRIAVSPKIERMLSTPRPRTSRKSRSIGGQRPWIVSGPICCSSTTSSATSPWPREISSDSSRTTRSPACVSLSSPSKVSRLPRRNTLHPRCSCSARNTASWLPASSTATSSGSSSCVLIPAATPARAPRRSRHRRDHRRWPLPAS